MYELHGEITDEEEEGQVCASSAHAEDGEGGVDAGVDVSDDVDVYLRKIIFNTKKQLCC